MPPEPPAVGRVGKVPDCIAATRFRPASTICLPAVISRLLWLVRRVS